MQRTLDRGRFDVDKLNEDGRGALHCAALNCHAKVCEFLLENGADLNLMGNMKIGAVVFNAQGEKSNKFFHDKGMVGRFKPVYVSLYGTALKWQQNLGILA